MRKPRGFWFKQQERIGFGRELRIVEEQTVISDKDSRKKTHDIGGLVSESHLEYKSRKWQ